MPGRRNNRQALSNFLLVWLALVILLGLIQGCATMRHRSTLPKALEDEVRIPGFPDDVRAWADQPSKSFARSAVESIEQERAAYGEKSLREPAAFLALSGGGDNGAFGAGLLCGWSAAGTRPRFKLVTGISTGAIIAPFAFLGPEYDSALRVYTMVTQKEIFRKRNKLTVLWHSSLTKTHPLAELIAKYIDEPTLQAIAAEHNKGRRLFIATTQFDAQRLVIWNMGAIAASGHPDALKLFRQVVLASASIPGVFPPQYIKVEAGGRTYTEMHVDGGTMAQVILYESALGPFDKEEEMMGIKRPDRAKILYAIRNSRIKPNWEKVKSRLLPIAFRAINTLIKAQSLGDLYRLYVFARRDGLDYNLAIIPKDFPPAPKEMFNQAYMNKLFDRAYEMARKGYPWRKHPPFFNPESIFQLQEKGRLEE